jgi:ABC-type glycerol-3-phosphate transport system permease component
MNSHSNPFEKKSSKERLADELEKKNVYLIPEQFSVMSLPNYYAASESPKPRQKKRSWSFIIMFIVIWIELLIMTAVAVTMVVLKLKLKGLLIFLTVGWIIIVIEVAVSENYDTYNELNFLNVCSRSFTSFSYPRRI